MGWVTSCGRDGPKLARAFRSWSGDEEGGGREEKPYITQRREVLNVRAVGGMWGFWIPTHSPLIGEGLEPSASE